MKPTSLSISRRSALVALAPLLAPLPSASGAASAAHRVGRIVWTGSRSADAGHLDWAQLAPPVAIGQPSGFQDQIATKCVRDVDTYAQTKYALELVNVS